MAGLLFIDLLLAMCVYFILFYLYFKASVSAVYLDKFQGTHCIAHSYCLILPLF